MPDTAASESQVKPAKLSNIGSETMVKSRSDLLNQSVHDTPAPILPLSQKTAHSRGMTYDVNEYIGSLKLESSRVRFTIARISDRR